MAQDDPQKHRFIPIRRKLFAATLVSGSLAILIAGAGLYCMNQLNRQLQEVVGSASAKVKLTNLLRQELSTLFQSERNLLLVTEQDEFDRIATAMDSMFETVDRHIAELGAIFDSEDRARLNQLQSDLEKWKENHRMVREYSGLDAQRTARELSLGDGERAFNSFEQAINRMVVDITAAENQNRSPAVESEQDGESSDQPTEDERTDKLNRLAELRRDTLKLQRVEKNLILQASLATVQSPEETIGPFRKQLDTHLKNLKELLDEQEMTSLAAAEQHLNQYLNTVDEIVQVVQQKGNIFGYQLVKNQGAPIAEKCEAIVGSMVRQSEQSLDEYQSQSASLYNLFRNALVLLSALAVAAGVFVSMRVGKRVSNNIRELNDYAGGIQNIDDLTRPMPKPSDDEIGELSDTFNAMRVSLLRQNSQLAKLNDSLEHKNEEMEQFVYSVSHDLKSPLVSCKGLVGLINEDLDDGDFQEARNSAKRLSDVTDQMSNTIDDLLTFSRLGRNPLEIVNVDVAALVSELIAEWKSRPETANIRFEVAEDLPPVDADLIALQRVFDNLIGNAVKYACAENPDARVEIGFKRMRPGNKVRYFVRDNGPGIEPQYHERIFSLFQRLDTDTKGTGIGLASVAKTIRSHHGRVWVESEAGQGATFWIELPETQETELLETRRSWEWDSV